MNRSGPHFLDCLLSDLGWQSKFILTYVASVSHRAFFPCVQNVAGGSCSSLPIARVFYVNRHHPCNLEFDKTLADQSDGNVLLCHSIEVTPAWYKHVSFPGQQHAAINWAQRLKRVFNIDISICEACGGAVKIIASIEDPAVIKQILTHLQRKAEPKEFNPLPESRAPPQISLFG